MYPSDDPLGPFSRVMHCNRIDSHFYFCRMFDVEIRVS